MESTNTVIATSVSDNKKYLSKRVLRSIVKYIKSEKNCQDCGISYPSEVLDFDHITSDKKFNISDAGRDLRISLAELENELLKCQLVCANCHRLRTKMRYEKGKENRILEIARNLNKTVFSQPIPIKEADVAPEIQVMKCITRVASKDHTCIKCQKQINKQERYIVRSGKKGDKYNEVWFSEKMHYTCGVSYLNEGKDMELDKLFMSMWDTMIRYHDRYKMTNERDLDKFETRIELMHEEQGEVAEAIVNKDEKNLAEEAADIIGIALGNIVCLGLNPIDVLNSLREKMAYRIDNGYMVRFADGSYKVTYKTKAKRLLQERSGSKLEMAPKVLDPDILSLLTKKETDTIHSNNKSFYGSENK